MLPGEIPRGSWRTDPRGLPGTQLGYSAVVIVEQSLDSGTVIEVVNKRASPMALDAVVVAAAPAAQADSTRVAERPRTATRSPIAGRASVAKPAARPLRRLDDRKCKSLARCRQTPCRSCGGSSSREA